MNLFNKTTEKENVPLPPLSFRMRPQDFSEGKMKISRAKRPSREILARIHSLREKKGIIAVIEPETGEYFLGKTLTEALKEAKQKYPGKIFYSIRIGYTFVHEHKGEMRRL